MQSVNKFAYQMAKDNRVVHVEMVTLFMKINTSLYRILN